jgi:hypothetical protein
MNRLATFLTAAATISVLSACGTNPAFNAQAAKGHGLTASKKAQPTGPKQGISSIYTVLQSAGSWTFAVLDLNKDAKVSEAEAQTVKFSDATFAKADFNHDAVLLREEFDRWYATVVSPASANGVRAHLAEDFAKLDADKDGFLSSAEAGIPNPAKKLGHAVGLIIEGETLVECGGFAAADFKAADETGDAKLVRSEFEDLWALSIKRRLGVK